MKRLKLLVLIFVLSLTACGGADAPEAGTEKSGGSGDPEAEPVELNVFAAASLTETVDQIVGLYKNDVPQVTVIPTFDSSGTLLKQIREGAECDLFLSAAPTQMDALEEEGALLEGTRRDLLENRVVLAVSEGNPGGIEGFDRLAKRLESGDVLLAMGNSDVPVGQYTRKIFDYYGLEEEALASSGVLTYGSNVKEVTVQVSEAAVDCGIIYATDARSAGLEAVDSAAAEMCGQVIYPAAVLNRTPHPEEARAFLEFLSSEEAEAVFESVGFTPIR